LLLPDAIMYNQAVSATLSQNDRVPPMSGDVPGRVGVGRLLNVVKAYPMGNREYVA
jgi:hypothetical protein